MIFKDLPDLTEKDRRRVLRYIDIRTPDECWPWRSGTDGRYGKTSFNQDEFKAHRVAYFLFKGVKPDVTKDVCHTCDNPPCCNPNHLFEGTRSVNLQDSISKGRYFRNPLKGESNPGVKLSEQQVREIRLRYVPRKVTTRQLASEYGVARSLIHRIVTGQSRL